jgi:hypothetical protein
MKAWAGIQFNEHCDEPASGRHFPPRLQTRIRGHREQAAWFALAVGRSRHWLKMKDPNAPAVKREERTRSEARGGGLGKVKMSDALERACAQVGRFLYYFAQLKTQIDEALAKSFGLDGSESKQGTQT